MTNLQGHSRWRLCSQGPLPLDDAETYRLFYCHTLSIEILLYFYPFAWKKLTGDIKKKWSLLRDGNGT